MIDCHYVYCPNFLLMFKGWVLESRHQCSEQNAILKEAALIFRFLNASKKNRY